MPWSDARRSTSGAADLMKSRGPTDYCTRGGQRAKNRSCPQAPSDRPAPQRPLFATTFQKKRILMGTWCQCTSSGLAGRHLPRFMPVPCRPSDAMRLLAVPRYWVAGPHFKYTVVRNKQDTNRHYLTIGTNTSTTSVTIIK